MILKTLSFLAALTALICVVQCAHKSDQQLKNDYKLKPNELEVYKRAFSVFDRNDDHHVTENEVVETMAALKQPVTAAHLKELRAGDGNQDGKLDLDEFIHLATTKGDVDFTFQTLFGSIDKNKDKSVTVDELQKWSTETLKRNVTRIDVEKDIQLADGSQDGNINFIEFLAVLKTELRRAQRAN